MRFSIKSIKTAKIGKNWTLLKISIEVLGSSKDLG
jgi:hypothetical protein